MAVLCESPRWKTHNKSSTSRACLTSPRWFTVISCQLGKREGEREWKDDKDDSLQHANFPLQARKWPIMFNIFCLGGGRKEQRLRVGWREESSVANSIVKIIPYHLLPVKARPKFVFVLYTWQSGGSKEHRDTEWATQAPWSTFT